jgi:hypothetical protein
LIDVMDNNGTTPDEIVWPAVEDFTPSTTIADRSEGEEPEAEPA